MDGDRFFATFIGATVLAAVPLGAKSFYLPVLVGFVVAASLEVYVWGKKQ